MGVVIWLRWLCFAAWVKSFGISSGLIGCHFVGGLASFLVVFVLSHESWSLVSAVSVRLVRVGLFWGYIGIVFNQRPFKASCNPNYLYIALRVTAN